MDRNCKSRSSRNGILDMLMGSEERDHSEILRIGKNKRARSHQVPFNNGGGEREQGDRGCTALALEGRLGERPRKDLGRAKREREDRGSI